MTDDGYRAACWACESLGNYANLTDAYNAELQHQINKHPAQLSPAPGTPAGTDNPGGRVRQGRRALTRDQKRGKFPKPGKKR